MDRREQVRLVGRIDEAAVLDRVLRAVQRDRAARFVEVVGEPGIGKTSLLATLSADGAHLVLDGRAAEFERDWPFGVFVDALDGHLAMLGPSRLERLEGERLRELAAVLPSLEAFVDGPVAVLGSDRFRLHRAVRSLLERLAGERPLVLVLDDLHWADTASCDLVASLLRRPPEAAVLLALAYRTGRAPARLAGTLADAGAGGLLERIELGPLSAPACEELIAPRVRGAAARQRLREESGGNPFYLEHLARAAGAAGGLIERATSDALLDEVPLAVANALAAEVGALSGLAQAVVQAAAVAGEPFEPDVVAPIAGVAEADALVALDELLDADLIRETALPRRFCFRHPLVRHAVYGSIKGGWRLAAHARAASVLRARGAGAVACAPHLEHSASVGDEQAIALLVEAATAAAGRAPGSSARWWQSALRLVPEHGPLSERRIELLPRVAGALAAAGRLEDAHVTLLQALELVSPDDAQRWVMLVTACAEVENILGHCEQAGRRLLAARDAAQPHTREAVLLELGLAICATLMNDVQPACDGARRAIAGGRVLDDVPLQAWGAAVLSCALYFAGQTAEAQAAHDDATALLPGLDRAAAQERIQTLFFLAWVELFLGRYVDGEARFAQAIALARSSGLEQLTFEMLGGRVVCLVAVGRIDEAFVLSDELTEAAQVMGDSTILSFAHSARSNALLAAGDTAGALVAGEQGVEIARRLSVNAMRGGAGWTCSAALLEAGKPQEAIDVMLELLGGPELPVYFLGMRPLCYEVLTRAELTLGRPQQAREWAARAADVAARADVPIGYAHADRATAAVLFAREDWSAAAVAAERSAAHAEATGARIEAARARLLAGRALAATGQRERAGEQLRVAESEFAACGAERWRQESVRELRRIGRRIHRAGRRAASDATGLASLSGREREVAAHVRDHKTNREIAGELFLSEKTIETHLRNIFAKLGVDSRAQVARALDKQPSIPG